MSVLFRAGVLCWLASGISCLPETFVEPQVERGVLDLSQHDLSDNTLDLAGAWRFYPGRLLEAEELAGADQALATELTVPGVWTATMQGQATGFGTYRLQVLLPPGGRSDLALRIGWIASAAQIYANGRLIFGGPRGGGRAAVSRDEYRPFKGSAVALIGEPGERLEFLIQVANFHDRDGGIMRAPTLGPAHLILAQRERAIFADAFLAGSIFLFGLYHLALFLNRREDRPALWLGFFCLVIAARVLLTGEYLANRLLDLPYVWQNRLEILSIYAAVPLFTACLDATFAHDYRVYARWFFFGTGGLATVFTIALPMPQMARILTLFMIVLGAGLIYATGVWTHAARGGRTGARTSFAGGAVFVISIINDMLYSGGLIQTARLAPCGLFVFILSQAYILARIFADSYRGVRSLADALRGTRDACARFVPTQFLEQLGQRDVIAVAPGQQLQREMTVMFANIRRFSALSGAMSPLEKFNFLNSYLKRMTPIVQENNGFVDRYIGDAIMALFPTGPEDALEAAVAMQRELRQYNHNRVRQNLEPIRVGIGLHHGDLTLGIVGSEDRLQGTIISDAVSLASRIEGLTRAYNAHILISEAVLQGLPSPESYRMRLVDRVRLKSKPVYVAVYEVVEGVSEYLLELFDRTRADFDRGLLCFQNGDLNEARHRMRRVLEVNRNDAAARLYLKRCASATVPASALRSGAGGGASAAARRAERAVDATPAGETSDGGANREGEQPPDPRAGW